MVYLAKALVLQDGDRGRLEALTRGRSVSATMAARARTVLLAADGLPNVEIERLTGSTRPTVLKWRNRYSEGGVEALADAPRPGKEPVIDELALVAETLANDGKPPAELGISHWSARSMAAWFGVSFSSVSRIWRKWNIAPHRIETFKFSTDPQLEAKLRDAVGLYMSPPENAVVVSVDEKSQIQALERTGPTSRSPRTTPPNTHDYKRNGTTTLFAHPQAPEREGLVGPEPEGHTALHTHELFLAEHGRDLLRPDHPPSHQTRIHRPGQRPGRHDSHLHRQIQRIRLLVPWVVKTADYLPGKIKRECLNNGGSGVGLTRRAVPGGED